MIRRSPLHCYHNDEHPARLSCDGLDIAEQASRGKLLLRIRGELQTSERGLTQVLGGALPTKTNSTAGENPLVLWLGPRKWMIVCDEQNTVHLQRQMREQLKATTSLVSDCSDARAVIRIRGTHARALIAKSSTLDLHPRRFAPDHCAQTLFARVPVLIHQVDVVPTFDLYFDSSLAIYAWQWLTDAADEFVQRSTSKPAVGTNV